MKKNFVVQSACILIGFLCCAFLLNAEEQVWDDAGTDNIWSTNAPNWTSGALWTNGNSAVFSGAGGTQAGETVDVSNDVVVAGLSFQTNGYVIADADNNGTLTLSGTPDIGVAGASGSAAVSEVIAGSGGFNKTGAGRLQVTAANTYSGVTTVKAGTLRLSDNVPAALGAAGTGNGTVVEDGATLDIYSAYKANVNEDVTIKGTGVGGAGAFVNNGPTPYYNVGYRNLTLAGDATIGGSQRFDMVSGAAYIGNGFTLTKAGLCEVAVGRPVTNSPIVINAGTYTIQHAEALGGTDYPTTLNGGKLLSWGSYTMAEPLIVNGGTLTTSGSGIQTFKLTGPLTLNSNVTVQTEYSSTNTLDLAGVISGAGGLTRNGGGYVYVTGDANTFSGPTIVPGGTRFWVGKTVGGTGRLGSGAVTNSGSLYANSAVLGSGVVVNNGGGLYLNPPELSAGRIVNLSGTVYGTSVVQAANGVVNGGTWNSYSGSFGASAVTNAGGGTLNLYTNALTYGQFANGGTLSVWQSMTLPDPITFIGGTLYVNGLSNKLFVAGPVTLAGNASFSGTASSVTEVSGQLSGPGGIIRSGDGVCVITGEANDYTGPTIVNSDKSLFVGKPAGAAGGLLGAGVITNQGYLYFDSTGAYANTGGLSGWGTTAIRYGGQLTFNGGMSSNYNFHVANGSLTLTGGAVFSVFNELTIANRMNVSYGTAPAGSLLPTNVVATVTVNEGCTLIVRSMTFGNGGDLSGGTMTGILNQVGGVVRTTANAAEENGVRLGHYPQTRSFYNMMGGQLFVENNWDLCCATDGQGWFNMTGGAVFAKRVMLNERDNAINPGGYGRFTLSGGTLNLGSLTGSTVALSNGICADPAAPYLLELGGAGGTIRAVTNLWIPARATLFGSNENAITFDTQAWTVTLTNMLSGAGGLNKTGTGTLELSGNNTYTGATRILQGRLVPASAHALPAGGQVLFGVTADDAGGVLHATGDFSLAGLNVGVINPETLDRTKHYTIVTCDGELSDLVASSSLPEPWYLYYDWQNDKVELRSETGTVIRMR